MGNGSDETSEERGVERWLTPFLRDHTLWPVTTVAVGSSVTLGAALLLLAFGERNGFALAGVGILALVTVELLVRSLRERRLGLGVRVLLGWWLLSGGAAALAARSGLL